jgi:uncharacterized protein (DUF736 family)
VNVCEDDSRHAGSIRIISISAQVEFLPNVNKLAVAQPDYRVMTQGIEISAGWTKKDATSGQDYVSLTLAAPEFGPRKLYANLGRAPGEDDNKLYALIWNPTDRSTLKLRPGDFICGLKNENLRTFTRADSKFWLKAQYANHANRTPCNCQITPLSNDGCSSAVRTYSVTETLGRSSSC